MKKRIPLDQVIPNPDQPRQSFDPVKLRELADSIRERGLMQAITVRPIHEGDKLWQTDTNTAENCQRGQARPLSPTQRASSTERVRSTDLTKDATESASPKARSTTVTKCSASSDRNGEISDRFAGSTTSSGPESGVRRTGQSRALGSQSSSCRTSHRTCASSESELNTCSQQSGITSPTGGMSGRRSRIGRLPLDGTARPNVNSPQRSNGAQMRSGTGHESSGSNLDHRAGGTMDGPPSRMKSSRPSTGKNRTDSSLKESVVQPAGAEGERDCSGYPTSPQLRYVIVSGERRFRAHCLLRDDGVPGFDSITCEVVSIDEDEMALQAIIENLQRADIKAIEEARAFQAMLDRGWTPEKLAKDLGVQPNRIVARTALLDLDETIQSLVDSGQFPLGHANYLVDLPKQDQVAIVRLFSSGKLKDWSGVRAAAQAVRDRIAQRGMFDDKPEPSREDREAMSRMERMVERLVSVIGSGFKDGEFVAAKTVDPNKATKLADTVATAARTLRNIESQLRAAHARAELLH